MAELKFLRGSYTNWAGLTKDADSFYIVEEENGRFSLYLGEKFLCDGVSEKDLADAVAALQAADAALDGRVKALESAVGEGGSVAAQIKAAIEALDKEVSGVSTDGLVTVKVTEVDGKLDTVVVTTNDIAKASELDALEAAVGTGFTAEDTVAAAIAANEKAIEDEAKRAGDAEAALDERLDAIEGEGDGSIKKAVADAKAALEGTFKDGDAQTLAALNTKIENVSAEAKSYEVVAVTEGLETNVREAYKLVDEGGTQVGATIKVYKDSALKEVKLEEQTLKFTYIKVDGTEETVGVDVSKFLSETEFKDGLDVVDGVVSVNVGEDTDANKNFLDLEADGDGNKALAVRSIDTDSTVTTDRILVAGGPLDSTALRGILPKDESGNAYIEAGTDVQSLLLSLFTKVEWPTPTVTEGKIDTTIAQPSFTLDKSGTVEVGTVATLSDATLSEVVNQTTGRTISTFTYGYATAVDGAIIKQTSITIAATNVGVNSDNYTMTRDFTGFANADDSATPSTTASDVKLDGTTCTVVEGTNKVKITVTGPKGTCQFAEAPQYYVASNVGTLSDEHMSPSEALATVNESTTPSNSKELSVTGSYKYFLGYSDKTTYDQFDSASVRALTTKSNWITKDGTTIIVDANAIASNGKSIVVACPSKYKLATINNGVGASILANFSSVGEVDVTTGSITTKYKVYVYPITNSAVVEFKNVTLTKA